MVDVNADGLAITGVIIGDITTITLLQTGDKDDTDF